MLALALAAGTFDEAPAQGLTTYVESSGTEQKPRSNAGLSVQGERLRMRADFALRAQQLAAPIHALQPRPAGLTEVVPNLRSAFTIAKNLDIETRVTFAEWNAQSNTTFDTRVRYRKALDAFFDEFDGSLWRSPEGLMRQSLRFGFNQIYGDDVSPLTITGAAIFEASQNAAAAPAGRSSDSRKVGFETRVAGFTPAFLAGDHALRFKIEKAAGTRPESSSTVTYDQSWTLSPLTKLGVNLQFLRQTYNPADDFEPTIAFSWRSQF